MSCLISQYITRIVVYLLIGFGFYIYGLKTYLIFHIDIFYALRDWNKFFIIFENKHKKYIYNDASFTCFIFILSSILLFVFLWVMWRYLWERGYLHLHLHLQTNHLHRIIHKSLHFLRHVIILVLFLLALVCSCSHHTKSHICC